MRIGVLSVLSSCREGAKSLGREVGVPSLWPGPLRPRVGALSVKLTPNSPTCGCPSSVQRSRGPHRFRHVSLLVDRRLLQTRATSSTTADYPALHTVWASLSVPNPATWTTFARAVPFDHIQGKMLRTSSNLQLQAQRRDMRKRSCITLKPTNAIERRGPTILLAAPFYLRAASFSTVASSGFFHNPLWYSI